MVSQGPLLLSLCQSRPFPLIRSISLRLSSNHVLATVTKQVVGLGGATNQTTMDDLLDAVALGAGDGMHPPAKI